MSTISVPLTLELERSLRDLVKSGYGANKADVIRRALQRLVEEESLERVLRAQREIREGKGLKGSLRDLAKRIS